MADSPRTSADGTTDPLDALSRPPPRGRRRTWIAVIVLALVAAGAAAYYYFYMRAPAEESADAGAKGKGKGKGKGGAGRPVPITAAPVRTADMPVYLSGLGTVTPLATVVVRSRVDGQLMRLHFREGEVVKAGQLLAEIDPRPFQVQLAQAEGQLAKDQALLKNGIIDLDRYQTLFKQDSIAKQQLDTQAALVRQYESTIKVDQAAVDNAKLQLTYSRVTAPLTGRIGLRQVDAGNIVRAGDANGIVVITQLQPVSVIFTIPEDNVSTVMQRMKAGEKLPVDAWDRAEKTRLARGTLSTVDNQIDPATGTVKLRAQFTNSDFALFPNQFVNARMLVDTLRDATVLPTAAVQRGSQGTFVYVVREDSTVTVRPVKLGPVQGELVAVESGVTPGESVVTDGGDRLREGARVEIADRSLRPEKGGGKGRGRGKGGGGEGKSAEGAQPATGEQPAPAPKAPADNQPVRERRDAQKDAAAAKGEAPRERGKGEGRGKREGETDEERERRRAEWRNKSDAEKAEWRKKREERQKERQQ